MAKWWINYPWRMIQTNLRQIDMQDIQADQFARDIQSFNANVVLFNASGIIANYPTDLDFEPVNDYLGEVSAAEIVSKCNELGIRVIARTDYSKVRLSVYEKHPDWAYRTSKGGIINYNGDIHACPNGPYQQEYVFKIISDMFDRIPFDGIFFNMAGFRTVDYSYNYYGLCHCENCKRKFREYSGLEIPEKEDFDDPVYQKYRAFLDDCTNDLNKRLRDHVRSINPEIAVDGYDFQRMESNTEIKRPLPVWQYSASSNTRNIRSRDGSMRCSNSSVDYLGFPYRHVAVSPHLQELRLWQNVANLGGVDYFVIGRLENHGDKSAYEGIKKVFKFAADNYSELEGLCPQSQVLVIRKSLWEDSAEERGWIRTLTESHIPFDELRMVKLFDSEQIKHYKLIILPDIRYVSGKQAEMLDNFCEAGGIVLATGESAQYTEKYEPRHAVPLHCMGIEELYYRRTDMISAIFQVASQEDKQYFGRFQNSAYIAFGPELIFSKPHKDAKGWLRLIPPQTYGPPERCYSVLETDIPGFTSFSCGRGLGIYIPCRPGAFFYEEGYSNTQWFMQDILEQICNVRGIAPGLTPMVETTLARRSGRYVVQMVNTSGHFGNSYFKPLPVENIHLQIPVTGNVTAVRTLGSKEHLPYKQDRDIAAIVVPHLDEYEAVVIETND